MKPLSLLLLILVPSFCFARTRNYYIAAEEMTWNYAPAQLDLLHAREIPREWRRVGYEWKKTRFIEYTAADFSTKKAQPAWLGIMGPIIRAEVGDQIVVHFWNRTSRPHDIHPHGMRYDKDSEGAHYIPFGSGALVQPGAKFTYHWFADAESGPGKDDGSSVVWMYHPHVDEPTEVNAGLIGPIIVTAKGKAKPDGSPKDVNREFVALFMIFDELKGKTNGLFHSINGYVFGNLPAFVMTKGEKVRWHLLAMGNERDLHTAHWHGKTVEVHQRHTDVVELLPASMVSVDMLADNPGTWLFHCQVSDHMESGMMATFTIQQPKRSCPVQFPTGNFFGSPGQLDVQFKNSGLKSIRKIELQAEYLSGGVQNIHGFPDLWKWEMNVKPGEEKMLEFQDYFRQKGMTGFFNDRAILGWAVLPARIEFTDGTSWKPRQRGECSDIFWRDFEHPELEALPPLQPDIELPEHEM